MRADVLVQIHLHFLENPDLFMVPVEKGWERETRKRWQKINQETNTSAGTEIKKVFPGSRKRSMSLESLDFAIKKQNRVTQYFFNAERLKENRMA